MTNDERLNLRARQIMGDPSLDVAHQIPNADSLFHVLVETVRQQPDYLQTILDEITDVVVKGAMRQLIQAEFAA